MTTERLITAGLAINTHKAYSRGMASFREFLNQLGLTEVWPVPLNHIIWFIAFQHIKESAHSTITNYLSGISYYHKIRNMTDPTKSFIVTNMLKGFRKMKPQKDTRLPITIDILAHLPRVLQKICKSQFEMILFKAAFYLSFYGLLRISEIVFNSSAPLKTLSNDDVQLIENKLYVRIRY